MICPRHGDQNIIVQNNGTRVCFDCLDEKAREVTAKGTFGQHPNEKQVGGEHYKRGDGPQHWDMVYEFDLDYFQGNITKYLFRWRQKNGVEDLKKAQHYLEKYLQIAEMEVATGKRPK